jgi:hypothetical protein
LLNTKISLSIKKFVVQTVGTGSANFVYVKMAIFSFSLD